MAGQLRAWAQDVNFGRQVGCHRRVRLTTYRHGGCVCADVAQLAIIFQVGVADFRAAVKHARGYFVETRPEYMAQLQRAGAVGLVATKVALVGVRLAARTLLSMGADLHATKALADLSNANPPPLMLPAPAQRAEQEQPHAMPLMASSTAIMMSPAPAYLSPPPPPHTASASRVVFPTTLPTTLLSTEQLKERYGIPKDQVPHALKNQLASFKAWSSQDINLLRGPRYAHGVQSSTMDTHVRSILGYMGFVALYNNIPPEQLNMNAYMEPQTFALFLSYLRARMVTRQPLVAHTGLARKVVEFLMSGETGVDALSHAKHMDKWLERLEHQLVTAIPLLPKSDKPQAEVVVAWGNEFCDNTLQRLETCMETVGCMTHNVALDVQDAVLVSLVSGCHMPPVRLNLITGWQHPDFAAALGCQDKDCRRGVSCKGNHLEVKTRPQDGSDASPDLEEEEEWYFGYKQKKISSYVVHGKTEFRSAGGVNLDYDLPRGPLTKLLLAHMSEGHTLLTQEKITPVPSLFVTTTGIAFSAPPLFTQAWKRIMINCPIAARLGLKYFAPSAARTVFVEGYTSTHGVGPDTWDGAALIMGNSVSQWFASYNPSRKRRLAQVAISHHSSYIANMVNVDLTNI